MKLTIEEVVQAVRGKLVTGNARDVARGVSTDTRTLRKGDLFFALKGERDGHDFLAEAIAKGASGAVVSGEIKPALMACGRNLIQVPDTLCALGDLAVFWRRRFSIPVVAVTGSNGKTTTKEMLAVILAKKYRLLKTEGNFNNLIGLPLTLFRLQKKIQMVVVELGMNAPGEIARLAEIASPRVGIITNIGRAHLAGLKDLDGVARAKGELLERLPSSGLAVLNADDVYFPVLQKLLGASGTKCVSFGQKQGDVRTETITSQGTKGSSFRVVGTGFKRAATFYLPVPGRQNVSNALAALTVGAYFELTPTQMARALAKFRMPANRMETLRVAGVDIINDTYNANPDSMRSALALLAEAGHSKGRRTIAILGDMFELGAHAEAAHRSLGQEVARLGISVLIAVGLWAEQVTAGAQQVQTFSFVSTEKLEHQWSLPLRKGDLILIKGSRGMKMERVTSFLKEKLKPRKEAA